MPDAGKLGIYLRALIGSYAEVYRGRWDPRTAFWAVVFTYAVLVFLTLVLPHWPIVGLAIGVLILGILSLVPVMFLWLARPIAQMMRATIPAPPSLT